MTQRPAIDISDVIPGYVVEDDDYRPPRRAPRKPITAPLPDGTVAWCTVCEKPVVAGDEYGSLYRSHFPPHAMMGSHEACAERERAKEQEDRRRRALESAERRVCSDFASCMRGPGFNDDLTHPPRWDHARFDNAEFRKRSSKKIVGAVERWSPENGSLLLCAFTGAGKTAAALAWLYRARDAAIAKVRVGEKGDFPSFSFITGHELANCRRRWSIGEESPLMKLATQVELLVLDDLGCEPWPNEETFEVFDHRYRAGRRTIVTTGLSVAGFRGRYGEAIYRRIIEPGAVVEAMQ